MSKAKVENVAKTEKCLDLSFARLCVMKRIEEEEREKAKTKRKAEIKAEREEIKIRNTRARKYSWKKLLERIDKAVFRVVAVLMIALAVFL